VSPWQQPPQYELGSLCSSAYLRLGDRTNRRAVTAHAGGTASSFADQGGTLLEITYDETE
jgi:hypothetical protein